jgi:FkbM family methyltransferase
MRQVWRKLRRTTVRLILTPAVAHYRYTIRRGPARGLRREGGFDFLPERLRPSTPEERFLLELPLEGRTVYDVGAWEGTTALALARRVGPSGSVWAFEPNPTAAAKLRRNLGLNGMTNVSLLDVAVGDSTGEVDLAFQRNATGRAQIVSEAGGEQRGVLVRVPMATLDELREQRGLPPPHLIKIDVEGAETQVLRGARRTIVAHRPDLLLELHGRTFAEKRAKCESVLEELRELGYDGRHVETGAPLAETPLAERTLEGHLFCTPA